MYKEIVKIDGKWTFIMKEKTKSNISVIKYEYIFDEDTQKILNK